MGQKRFITLCGICGAELCQEATICKECQRAFEPVAGGKTACEATPLDLRKYNSRMFPWEPIATPPRLISAHLVWLILAVGLVFLVLLLALLRTPLPSCWELSSWLPYETAAR